jgi:hypothetical protein
VDFYLIAYPVKLPQNRICSTKHLIYTVLCTIRVSSSPPSDFCYREAAIAVSEPHTRKRLGFYEFTSDKCECIFESEGRFLFRVYVFSYVKGVTTPTCILYQYYSVESFHAQYYYFSYKSPNKDKNNDFSLFNILKKSRYDNDPFFAYL